MRTDGVFAMVRRKTEGFWRYCRFRGSQPCLALCLRLFFLPLRREEASALFIACGGLLWETGPGMDVWLLARLPPMRKERVGGNDASLPRRARIQSADKAHNRKNCPDKMKIGCNFCFLRQLHLHPAVTYVHVSSLGCKFASLACRLSQRSVSLLTLSTSRGEHFRQLQIDCIPISDIRQHKSRDERVKFRQKLGGGRKCAKKGARFSRTPQSVDKARKCKNRPDLPMRFLLPAADLPNAALTCGAWLRPDRRRARAGLPAIRVPCPPW